MISFFAAVDCRDDDGGKLKPINQLLYSDCCLWAMRWRWKHTEECQITNDGWMSAGAALKKEKKNRKELLSGICVENWFIIWYPYELCRWADVIMGENMSDIQRCDNPSDDELADEEFYFFRHLIVAECQSAATFGRRINPSCHKHFFNPCNVQWIIGISSKSYENIIIVIMIKFVIFPSSLSSVWPDISWWNIQIPNSLPLRDPE